MKNTPKHTPGPWVATFDPRERPGIEAGNTSIVLFGEIKNSNDDGGIRGRNDEEANANAHLIAAAPELLEALEALVACVECNESVPAWTSQWDIARAAIAKAKGDQL